MIHQVVNNCDKVSRVFAALSDPTRRRMLERLSRLGEHRITDLSKPFPITPPAVTKHLYVLERAQLIRRRRQGREHYVRANPGGMKDAQAWMQVCAKGWEYSLEKLDSLIRVEKGEAGS